MKARDYAACAVILPLVGLFSGCGEYVRNQGRAPVQLVIQRLQAAPGHDPGAFGGNLQSDVLTGTTTPDPCTPESPCFTVFNDIGQVTMGLLLKDPGGAGIAATPSLLNQVTVTRYRVAYRRSDGRNVPGVDVPHPIDGAVTFTVPNDGVIAASFEIVRNTAKSEAPLRALIGSGVIISTIADVTFFGRDQAGNNVDATGSMQISFGNFGNP